MKKIYKHVMLALVLVLSTANLNAQKHVTLRNDNTQACTIIIPENAQVIQNDNGIVSVMTTKNKQTNLKAAAVEHTLTISPVDGEWNSIHVASENGYYDYTQNHGLGSDGFSSIVEEGYYDIMVIGSFQNEYGELVRGIITLDQYGVFDDVTLSPSFAECVKTVYLNGEDLNGNSLDDLQYKENDYACCFSWANGTLDYWYYGFGIPFFYNQADCYFNGFDDRSSFFAAVNLHTADQQIYNLTFPVINGLSDDVTVSTAGEELFAQQEKYHILGDETSYFHNDYIYFTSEHNYFGITIWSRGIEFNPSEPLTLVTNNIVNDPIGFTDAPFAMSRPAVYEFFHDNTDYSNFIASFGLYVNGEKHFVKEPFGVMRNINYYSMPSYEGFLPNTPALEVYEDDDMLVTFGERTPMSYFQAFCFSAANPMLGVNAFVPALAFSIGENSSERVGDRSATLQVLFNGEELCCDSLYKWPDGEPMMFDQSGLAEVNVINDHLVIDGIEKYNHSHIEINFDGEDVCPPSLTILQVMDCDNNEVINVPDIGNAHINIATGDFSPHIDYENECFDYMQYDGKPNVEIYYSIDGINWESMECVENETMFHVNYGNYFTIDLAQLDGKVNNNWVSLKFVVTDEAGNSQVQELSNVFYAGHMTSVVEAQGLTHTVYPNPFSGEVRINAVEAVNGNANVSVFNVLGEQVISKAMNCNGTTEFVIDGSSLNAGIYFYSIATENGKLQGRIVKE